MGDVNGAKHAAPKHARGPKHAKHASNVKRTNGIYYAVGAVFVTAALAIGIFTLPAANQPQNVATSTGIVAGAPANAAEIDKASATRAAAVPTAEAETTDNVAPEDAAAQQAYAASENAAETESEGNTETTVEPTISAETNSADAVEPPSNAGQEAAADDAASQPVEAEPQTAEAESDSTSAEQSQTPELDDDASDAPAANDQPADAKAVAETPAGLLANKAKEVQTQSIEDEVVFYTSLIEDGATLDEETAEALASKPVAYTDSVGEMLQGGVLDSGCEIFSLAIVLRSMGLAPDPIAIADDYLDFEGGIEEGYMGSPYYGGGGFPSGIAKAANAYLDDKKSSFRAHDLTGNSFQALVGLVERGYPVLVWTTIDFEEPFLYNDLNESNQWYANEHCVVMYGVSDGNVLVSDPLEGLVTIEVAKFADLYELCGSMALLVR